MALPYEYTPNIWPLLASALFLSVMGFYAYRDRSVPGAVPFMFMVTLLLLWVISSALELAGTDSKTRIFWFKFDKALLLPAISAELCFALEYTGLYKWVTRRTVFALAILPFVFLLLILTNDTYHLIWTHIWSDSIVHVVRGPASWGAIFYAYLLSTLNLMVLARLFAHSTRHRWMAVGLIIALFITRGSFFFKIANWNPVAPFDPMLVAANFALLPYALAVLSFRMFDVVPVARHTVIEKMPDGMVVLDPKNRIADVNEVAQKILGVVKPKVIGRNVTEVLQAFPELLGLVRDSGETQCEVLIGDTRTRWYHISITPLIDRRGFHLGQLVLLHDITEQKAIQTQLLDHQRTLAMLSEREILGRELHDGIGQMLAAAQLQVKAACDLLAIQDTASAESCLHHLADVTQEAKESVREYLLGVKTRSSPEHGLLSALRRYLNHYSHNYGIHTELVVPPELEKKRFDSTIEAQLQPIIQEALTNVRRHSGASSARIIFTFNDGELSVMVEDDGKGFDPEEIDKNASFGLRSMRGRADMLGACLEVKPTPGKGTRVSIRVPWAKEKT
jgi:PAS domain S-box-containing protein